MNDRKKPFRTNKKTSSLWTSPRSTIVLLACVVVIVGWYLLPNKSVNARGTAGESFSIRRGSAHH